MALGKIPLPFPQAAFHPLTLATIYLGFCFPNLWTRILFLAVAGLWCVASMYNSSGVLFIDWLDAQSSMFVLTRGISQLFCHNPEKYVERHRPPLRTNGHAIQHTRSQIGRERAEKQSGEMISPEPLSTWERLKRGGRIFLAYRGYGWSFQVNGIPPAKPIGYSRSRFILEVLASIARNLVMLDIGLAWARNHPFLGMRPLQADLLEQPLLVALAYAATIGFGCRCALSVGHDLIMLVFVSTGTHEPSDWPPLFAPLTEACSIRRFWSYSWHQAHRLSLEPISRAIVYDMLGLSRDTTVGKNAKGCAVFFLSFVVHAYASITTGVSCINEFRLFMPQFVGTILEETVFSRLAYKPDSASQDRLYLRLLGYVWTATWVLPGALHWLHSLRGQGLAIEDQVNLGIGDRFIGMLS